MTIGEAAGLIAAIAFLILVCFVAVFLTNLGKTVKQATQSLDQLTKDADSLSKNVEKVVINTDELLSDLNQKSTELDPVVKALADVGESVSDVNGAARGLVEKAAAQRKKTSQAERILKGASKMAFASLATRLMNHRHQQKN